MKAVKFATQVDENVLKELKNYADKSDLSISKVVNDALIEYLGKYKVRPAFKLAMEDVLNENEELLKRLAR